MAKILTTKGSAAELEDIIRRADKTLYLISYSFIISEAFITRLEQAVSKGVIINIVYGKSIKDGSHSRLKEMANMKIFHCENLHAKLFANESKCIIGSMNFSEASEINNTEVGVLLSLQNDREAFEDAISHCKEIVDKANLERPMMPKSIRDENRIREDQNKTELKNSHKHLGYCIRTGKRIPLNHERPYSPEGYSEWVEYDNDDECEEKYDHFTGERTYGRTCRARPILNNNWKSYQKTVTDQ